MKFSFAKFESQKMARAMGKDLPISSKVSIEICNLLRNKKLDKAKALLERVIAQKEAVPYKRFNMDIGHKKSTGPGRYPIKAATHILSTLKSAENNASFAGLGSDLIIRHLSAQRAAAPWHYGRARRRKMKRTHIEVVLEEKTQSKKAKPVESKKAEAKAKEVKPKVNKEAPKAEKPKDKVQDKKVETKKDEKGAKQ